MVEKKEIEHLADLVKVNLSEPEKYIKQVERILNYFDRLDKVEFQSDETLGIQITTEDLREDIHIQYGDSLIEHLKKDQNNFIRAPKMV
ncbi:MAG: aspartyl/glutamyl-tRNA amidotransferase subunit C [Thaumarchaeota archaeon]|nr:aspartyl/glutamyl-tRNA amidotransferase subunit C [Nitrososphaerota archaeon]